MEFTSVLNGGMLQIGLKQLEEKQKDAGKHARQDDKYRQNYKLNNICSDLSGWVRRVMLQ